MKEQILQIGKDLEKGTIDEKTAQTKLLNLFSVSGCLYPSIEQRWEAAEIDIQRQKSYNAAYDRKRGFTEGVKWLQKWLLK